MCHKTEKRVHQFNWVIDHMEKDVWCKLRQNVYILIKMHVYAFDIHEIAHL